MPKNKIRRKEEAEVKVAQRTNGLKQDEVNAKKKKKKKKPPVNTSLPLPDLDKVVHDQMVSVFGTETPGLIPHKNRADEPCVVSSKSGGEIMVVNAPMIGALTAEKGRNPLRNALRLANAKRDRGEGCDAVIVPGDVLYAIVKKYGTDRPYATRVSGIKVDPDEVERSYPQSVLDDESFKRVSERLKDGEPVYIPQYLRLKFILDALRKTFRDDNDVPLFGGKIYVTFGKMEDELIKYYTNELQRIGLFKSRAWAQRRIEQYKPEYRACKKRHDEAGAAKAFKKIHDFRKWLSLYAIMANNADECVNKERQMVTNYLVEQYELCIPNCEVVSTGDAFLKMDGNSVMVTSNKSRNDYKGGTAGNLVSGTRSFSKGRETSTIPNVMLGNGMNPYLEVKMMLFQDSNKPDDKRECLFIQLPMCIDSSIYRDEIRGNNILKDVITRSARVGGFESGVITLRWVGLPHPVIRFYSSELLTNTEVFESNESLAAMLNGERPEHRVVVIRKEGCDHSSSTEQIHFPSPNDNRGIIFKTPYQVFSEMLIAMRAPVHCYFNDGDQMNALNHPYMKEPHPDALEPQDLMAEAFKIGLEPISDADKMKRLKEFFIKQSFIHVSHDFRTQIEGFVKTWEPYLPHFVNILERADKAGLKFSGTLEAIVHGNGNHNWNTWKNSNAHVNDAEIVQDLLKIALMKHLLENGRNELIELVSRGLKSPRCGKISEARGAVLLEGRSCFSIVMKHKQGDMKDTLNRAARRSNNEHEHGILAVNLSGDTHKFGFCVTRRTIHLKTGTSLGEGGAFGREIDGDDQNVGGAILMVPTGGMSCGAVELAIFGYSALQKYAMKPYPIDVASLFRNPL